MRPALAIAFSGALSGCTAADTTPTWAFDPIWIEPTAGGIHGFQTWQLYGPKWIENRKASTYACAVIVELEGAAVGCDPDTSCTQAWEVETEVSGSDCSELVSRDDPLFVSLRRLALGGPDTSPEAPWPGQTSVGWADYGNGWEVHGHAYPEALDLGGTVEASEWDGVQPYLMVPTQSFPFGAGSTTSGS